mgnify:CR=1 FL=1
MGVELGLDGSFTGGQVVPVEWFKRRRAEGYQVWAQCVWTGGLAGNDGIKRVAAGNLLNAIAGGLKVMAYANASPPTWWSLPIQMQRIKENCGAAWPFVQHLPVDVEIAGTTLARVTELANALKAEGKNSVEVLYSARWFWTGRMANSRDAAWLRWLIWNANYDFNRDVDFGSASYGPWTVADLIGEQFQGTTRLDGVDVDLNVFDVARLFPVALTPPAPPPEPEGGLTVGQFEELKRIIQEEHNWVQVKVHDAIVNRLAALEQRVAGQAPAPPAPPAPAPPAPVTTVPVYVIVKSGDAASNWVATEAVFLRLNPDFPTVAYNAAGGVMRRFSPARRWNDIYPPERLRIK